MAVQDNENNNIIKSKIHLSIYEMILWIGLVIIVLFLVPMNL